MKYESFCDLDGYLRRNPAHNDWVASEATIVARVGAWIGDQVLGQRSSQRRVPGNDLVTLLRLARGRLKFAVLHTCHSYAATAGETLRWFTLPDHVDDLPE